MPSSAPRDYYKLLGISSSASDDEIRHAYRHQARQYHPDANSSPHAAAQFALVAEAYSTLSNPARRRRYDSARAERQPQSVRLSPNPMPPAVAPMPFIPRFDAPYGPDRSLHHPPFTGTLERGALRGQDVQSTLTVTLYEAAHGVSRTLRVPRFDVCAICAGTGAEPNTHVTLCSTCQGVGWMGRQSQPCRRCFGNGLVPDAPCATCHGSGRTRGNIDLVVHVPAGIVSGEVLRWKGQGDPGARGGPRGELLVTVSVLPDPHFERHDADIYSSLLLTSTQAARGGRFSVTTLYGDRWLDVPARCRPGERFTLKGQGLPRASHFRKGDHIVTLRLTADTQDTPHA